MPIDFSLIYHIALKANEGVPPPPKFFLSSEEHDVLIVYLIYIQFSKTVIEPGWFFSFIHKMKKIFKLFPRENYSQEELFMAFSIFLYESKLVESVFIGLDIPDEKLEKFQETDEIQFLSSLVFITGIVSNDIEGNLPEKYEDKIRILMFRFLKPLC